MISKEERLQQIHEKNPPMNYKPTTKEIEDSVNVNALVGSIGALPDPKTLGKARTGMSL